MYQRSSWPDAAHLYRAQRQTIAGVIAAGIDDDRVDVDTVPVPACPAWTVADLTAHLAGSPAALLARSYPGDDAVAWVAGHVAERAGRTARANLAEWDDVGPGYDVLLTKNEEAWGSLLYDAIAHEHDLREALDRPGGREGVAVDYAVDRSLALLDKKATATGAGTLRITAGNRRWEVGDGEPNASLDVDSAWELMRVLGSRRSEPQVRAAITGDADPWLAVLPWATPAHDSAG